MNKVALCLVFLLCPLAHILGQDPETSYTIKPSGSLTISGRYSSPSACISGDCPNCTTDGGIFWAYGFRSPSGTSYWPPTTGGSGGFGLNVSVTVTPSSVGSTVTWVYRRRQVTMFKSCYTCTCNGSAGGFQEDIFNITVTTVADLARTTSLPSTTCANANAINLYSYVNKSSGVTFKDGATVIPSTFDPSKVSAGSHTIRASYTFDNGTTTVILGTINVLATATITGNPISASQCPGSSASFGVSASGEGLSYQWQESLTGGASFSDLVNTGVFSGVNNGTLNISNVSGLDGRVYRVRVTGTCNTTYSGNATLNLYGQVGVTSSPSDKGVCIGEDATFTAEGVPRSGTMVYRWQQSTDAGSTWENLADGTIGTATISGSGTAALTYGNAGAVQNGYRLRCVLSDACGANNQNVTSAATLTVYGPVSVINNPANQAVCLGGTISFKVTGSGPGVSYQWQESSNGGATYTNVTNVGVYSGATTGTLTLTGVTTGYNNYRYRAVVSGTCSTTNSAAAILNVVTPPSITSDPVGVTVCEASSANFSVTAAGTSLNYQWQYSSSGGAGTFANISGATSSSCTIASVTPANAGYYRVVAGNGCAGGGTPSGAARLDVNPLTTITQQPANASVCPEGVTTFSVSATGTGSLSYQWQVSGNGSAFTDLSDGDSYSGVTTLMLTVLSANSALNAYTYRVRVSGACGPSISSSNAVLTVNPIPVKPSVADPARCGDGPIAATATSPASSPIFKWYANESDVVPVFTGAAYQISNLTLTASYYVSVTSLNCESEKEAVTYTRHPLQGVPLGNPLALCVGQGLYNLENDIADNVARGEDFTWTANGTNYSSKNFDPSVGVGSYMVSYDPPSPAKVVPYCYVSTNRTVSVVSSTSEEGINFNDDLVSNGNTVNMCVGDDPVDISTFPSLEGGSWSTVSGSGLSFSGNAVVFTPNQTSYTEVVPNVFRYTVQVSGCSASKDLNIYVKDNQYPPILTGIPGVICPGEVLSIAATVSTPGTFSYEWFKAGEPFPFETGSNITYTVGGSESLQVRSINLPFGCHSEATLATITTPFSSGTIVVSKTVLDVGDYVTFSTDAPETGNTFRWAFGDGAVSTEKSPGHYYYAPGEFEVTLDINSNLGCSQTLTYKTITVSGDTINIITGVEDPARQIQVYPNPVTDEIRVKSLKGITAYALADLTGRTIHLKRSGTDKDFSLEMTGLKRGIYILQLHSGTMQWRGKIIKK